LALTDKKFCINPWREVSHGDACVSLDDIKHAEWVGDFDRPSGNDWLVVDTHDGRHITTELMKHQPGARDLARELRDAGVQIRSILVYDLA
jgi:hypothetical protein